MPSAHVPHLPRAGSGGSSRRRATSRRLAVLAVPVVPFLFALAAPAQAAVVDSGHTGISLDTYPVFSGDTLTVKAVATFNSSFVENSTVALQAVGSETWSDASGSHTAPLLGSPVAIAFQPRNEVNVVFSLHHDSIVSLSYTAEAAGLAPSPFTGSCAGTVARTNSSGTPLIEKTC